MEALKHLANFIKNAEPTEQYTYIGGSAGLFVIILGLIWYFSGSKISNYKELIKKTYIQKNEATSLLNSHKATKEQQEKVEELLTHNKEFRISQEFQSIVEKQNLTKNQGEEKPILSKGSTIDGTTESLLTASLTNITMKQLTDLLYAISKVKLLYPKELIIKRNPNNKTVDTSLVIATLEPTIEA
jgi:hypothetical protein